jgi:transcriptional regulator with XRE-family HTH domain
MARNYDVGVRIKMAREAKGMNPASLAKAVAVTSTAVWNWETNGITPRHETLEKLSKVLEKSIDYFRTGNEGPVAKLAAVPQQVTAQSVAEVVEQARAKIATMTGFALDRVKLHLEFTPA